MLSYNLFVLFKGTKSYPIYSLAINRSKAVKAKRQINYDFDMIVEIRLVCRHHKVEKNSRETFLTENSVKQL